jgi:lipopolysaccharide export system permease protein
MRVPRTLYLYLSREILEYGGLAFVGITAIMLSQNLLRRLDDLVVVGFSGSDLAELVRCLFSMLTAYATPIAFVFGVSLAVGRLSADGEVLAMRANGQGIRALVVPSLMIGMLVSALTGYLMIEVEPQAQRELRTTFKSVAARGGMLEPGKFRDVLGRVIFVESRDRENRLAGIVISDRSDGDYPFLIFAEHGSFQFDADQEVIRFRLENGDVHVEPRVLAPGEKASGSYQKIAFRSFDYSVDVSTLISGESTRYKPREMSLGELRENLERLRTGGDLDDLRERNPIEYQLQMHRRVALPVAPMICARVAVPLSLRRSRSGRSWGVLTSLVLVFAYYALLSFAQFLARDGWTSAAAAHWIPNAIFALGSLALLRLAPRVMLR